MPGERFSVSALFPGLPVEAHFPTLHLVELEGELVLLDQGGDDHAGGGPGDAGLAVEDDGRGGRRVLEEADDLVEALLGGGRLLVQGDPQGLDLGVLWSKLFLMFQYEK